MTSHEWKGKDIADLDINSLYCGVNPDSAIELAKSYQSKAMSHRLRAGEYALSAVLSVSPLDDNYANNTLMAKQESIKANIWEEACADILNTFFRIGE